MILFFYPQALFKISSQTGADLKNGKILMAKKIARTKFVRFAMSYLSVLSMGLVKSHRILILN